MTCAELIVELEVCLEEEEVVVVLPKAWNSSELCKVCRADA